MKPEQVRGHVSKNRTIIFLIGAFIFACAAVSVPFYSARSGSAPADPKAGANEPQSKVTSLVSLAGIDLPAYGAFLPQPVSSPEAIYTYAADCTTPKTDWNLGETVCAKANAVPLTVFPWRVLLVDPAGFVRDSREAIADDNATYTFVLPSSPTSIVNAQTVDNRGTWRVELVRANGSRRQTTVITVHDTANAVADVFAQKVLRDGDVTISTSSSVAFLLIVGNGGPDTAQNVHLVDTVPSGATLVSFSQQSGPACLPANAIDCTMASLANGERAEFTAIYQVGAAAGTVVTTAQATSGTTDSNNDNNNSFAEFEIIGGGSPSQCTLVCPTNLTFTEDPGTGGHTVLAANFPNPTTTGTCGDVSTTASPNPQTNSYFFPVGTSVITASTESGEICTFTVTVTDDEDPTINCPSDITVFESSPGSGSANVNFNVTGNDNSGSVTINCTHSSGDSFAVGPATEVVCTATDDSNNTATCSFDVTVTGVNNTCVLTTQPPIAIDSPSNACGATVTYTTPTSDGSGTCGTITCDHPSGSFFPVGDTLVTCTSSPDGGSTSFTVTVNDVTNPTPTLLSLPTLEGTCSVTAGVPVTIMTPTGPKVVLEPPTASDNCGGTISASTQNERTYDEPGSHVVTWDYTDASGNTVSQQQTVIVTGNDNVAPVPDVANLPVVTDECEVSVTPPIATDNCAGTVTGTTPDPLTYVGAGTYTIHWTYTDGTGNFSTQNQTVVVTDTHAPTIALVGDSSITVECHTSFDDPGVTTDDNCLPLNVTVAVTGQPNINVPNTYTVTYTATDGGGNQASVQRTVIVQDTLKPVITLNGGDMTVECHTSFTDPGASAADTCDTNVPVVVSGTVNINTPGTYVLTYNATDDSGNAADSLQRTVTVVDTTAPVITLNGYSPSMWPPNHKYKTFAVTDFVTGVSDSCDTPLGIGSVVIEKVTSDETENGNGDGNTDNDIVIAANCKSVQLRSERQGGGNGRVYTITFRVKDASGNTTTATAKVKVPHNSGGTVVDNGPNYTVNGTCP